MRDGTRAAIATVRDEAVRIGHWTEPVESGRLRAVMRPYDTVADTNRDRGLSARRPSRMLSIEEFPLALAFLRIADGDWAATVFDGVSYGRDSDSIATVGGGLGGIDASPRELADAASQASSLDLTGPAKRHADLTVRIRAADRVRDALARLGGEQVPT